MYFQKYKQRYQTIPKLQEHKFIETTVDPKRKWIKIWGI